MFNENSVVVQIWVRQVKEGHYTLDQVPDIYNLRAAVVSCLKEE